PVLQLLFDRGVHVRVRVTEGDRAKGADEVGVLVAVNVPQPRALGAGGEVGGDAQRELGDALGEGLGAQRNGAPGAFERRLRTGVARVGGGGVLQVQAIMSHERASPRCRSRAAARPRTASSSFGGRPKPGRIERTCSRLSGWPAAMSRTT